MEINEGYKDWQLNAYFNCTPSNKSIYRCAVPTSCCIFEKVNTTGIYIGVSDILRHSGLLIVSTRTRIRL